MRAVAALLLIWTPFLVAQQSAPSYPPPAEVKAAFLKLLDRPRVPLDAKLMDAKTEDGLVFENLSFASEKKADGSIERVPVLLVRPEKESGKRPAVIALHGTGGNKEGQKALLVQLARKGYVVTSVVSKGQPSGLGRFIALGGIGAIAMRPGEHLVVTYTYQA